MLFNSIIQWLLPATCVFCGFKSLREHNICAPCQQNLSYLPQGCRQCAHTLPSKNETHCMACLIDPPPFDQIYALFAYQAPIIRLITGLKFQHKLAHATALGELLAHQIQHAWYINQPLPDLIIPTPLHVKRLRQRGFNQALEIARPVAKALKLPLDKHCLRRTKYTAAQSSLSAQERLHNLSHAFSVHRSLEGLTVAIIDDVVTTTKTMRECCQSIKKAGAKRIEVWCIARAMVNMTTTQL